MAHRANQAFTTWVGGYRRRFAQDEIVPADVADAAPLLVYDDGTPKPTKRTAKKVAAPKSDD